MSSKLQIVFVGAGHANSLALKEVASKLKPSDSVELTLISDYPMAYYSGMLPGSIAGFYTESDISIDVISLCKYCNTRWIQGALVELNPEEQILYLDSGEEVYYDYCSINIGSTTRGNDTPGVEQYSISTRPLIELLTKIDHLDPSRFSDIVVVGAGAAGLELAWSMRARSGTDANISLINSRTSDEIGMEMGSSARSNCLSSLNHHNIQVYNSTKCIEVTPDTIILENGNELACSLCLWSTGAFPHKLLFEMPIEKDEKGFISVKRTLQSTQYDNIFAVGDCCSVVDSPWIKKAGVYAVREVLIHVL
eukprot:TRINITY_DN3604_c0_g1_i3.p1 TRINITY_DN3604_c0_g1~~TRINITY_DN3604_c0_g1_i3.p1  ORF type:complete len:308 (-),score=48.13 TRINITY_DN3604_c0_g1_i3:315-1238(-)